MAQMVFVPVSRAEASALRASGVLGGERAGYAASPSLLRAHDYDESTLEDAEFAALSYAAVSLVRAADGDPLRLVLAAELSAAQVVLDPDSWYGLVSVREVGWRDVRALFSDQSSAGAALQAARRAAADRPLEEALEVPEVELLLEEHDLLWFAPDELEQLPSASPTGAN